jgi:hypothetical protein
MWSADWFAYWVSVCNRFANSVADAFSNAFIAAFEGAGVIERYRSGIRVANCIVCPVIATICGMVAPDSARSVSAVPRMSLKCR